MAEEPLKQNGQVSNKGFAAMVVAETTVVAASTLNKQTTLPATLEEETSLDIKQDDDIEISIRNVGAPEIEEEDDTSSMLLQGRQNDDPNGRHLSLGDDDSSSSYSSSECSLCNRTCSDSNCDEKYYDHRIKRHSCSASSDCSNRLSTILRKTSINVQTDFSYQEEEGDENIDDDLPSEHPISEESRSRSESNCDFSSSPSKKCSAPPPIPKRGNKLTSKQPQHDTRSGHALTHRIVINLDDKNRFTDEVTV